jgi:hypothetical protein
LVKRTTHAREVRKTAGEENAGEKQPTILYELWKISSILTMAKMTKLEMTNQLVQSSRATIL